MIRILYSFLYCFCNCIISDTVKDLLERVRHRKPSEIRSFIRQLPNHAFRKIFPKEDDFTTADDALDDESNDNGFITDAIDSAGTELVCEDIRELLPAACKRGDLETVKLLLFHEIDPSQRGREVRNLFCFLLVLLRLSMLSNLFT